MQKRPGDILGSQSATLPTDQEAVHSAGVTLELYLNPCQHTPHSTAQHRATIMGISTAEIAILIVQTLGAYLGVCGVGVFLSKYPRSSPFIPKDILSTLGRLTMMVSLRPILLPSLHPDLALVAFHTLCRSLTRAAAAVARAQALLPTITLSPPSVMLARFRCPSSFRLTSGHVIMISPPKDSSRSLAGLHGTRVPRRY